MEKYKQKLRCSNCGYNEEKEFNKGQSSDGYFVCPNCGCRDYKKSSYSTTKYFYPGDIIK
jgi:predicted nucleic-acid-binding Zn-ribbon protein